MERMRQVAPDAVSVTVEPGGFLRVMFENGEIRDFDVTTELYSRKAYKPLMDARMLATAHVENGVIMWANGLDLDPEWLYEESEPV